MKLAELARGRDNNFNLIRFAAALAVLISHSFALATGSGDAEPLRVTYGFTWGDIAVDVFFVTSGFLVTASLLSRKNAMSFVWARALRIFPALWAMLALSVFGIGLWLTSYGPHAYLAAHQTWKYLIDNAILFRGIQFELPGLFASNPMQYAVNGSLWTLQPEVQMYAILLGVWIVCALARARRVIALESSIVAIAVVSGVIYFFHGVFVDELHQFPRLAFMFFTGASCYVLKDRIELRWQIFVALLAIALVCALNRTEFFFALNLSLAYLVFYAAYCFGGWIRAFNKAGDYSYGIYIYAFIVQQTLACLIRGISVAKLMWLSAIITLLLAVLSWHLIEKRALALKDVCAERTRAMIGLKKQALQSVG